MNEAVAAQPSSSLADLYRAIWRHARGARGRLLGSTAMLTGSQVVKLAVPWMAAQAINALQVSGADAALGALGWVAGIVALFALSWSLHGPGRILERSVGIHVRESVADALLTRLLQTPLAWHERHHSGEVQHRVHRASAALYDFAQNQFVYLQNAVNIVGPLAALMLLSHAAGTVALAGYLVVGAVIVGFDIVLTRLAGQQNAADRRYAAALLDFLGNVSTVISLRLQAAARRTVGGRLQAVFVPLKRLIVLNEVKWCAVDLLTLVLSWSLVVVYAWETRAAGHALLIGSLFMVYQYAQQAGGVIGTLAAHFQNFARIRTDFASAGPIWEAPERAADGALIGRGWQELALRGGEYGYTRADGKPAGVFGAHLTLRRGERIALVGPSGSGKSTLLRLLAGLYDLQKGHYEVDGLPHPGVRHLGSVATLIPQEADVFEATVADNVAFGAACDGRTLDDALYVSAFDAVAAALPQGLATPISERGFNLSGGQRQRLALARGVLAAKSAGSTLVLLDEPTSALDPLTEARIHRRLDMAFPRATVVASVHRMSLLAHFDRVVLMVAGRIVDSGSVADLLERQLHFRQLYQGAREAEEALAGAAASAARMPAAG
jgi:ABC-type multidrug transport system fused ATPase/permease subunit